jgi:hypothetical protein
MPMPRRLSRFVKIGDPKVVFARNKKYKGFMYVMRPFDYNYSGLKDAYEQFKKVVDDLEGKDYQ